MRMRPRMTFTGRRDGKWQLLQTVHFSETIKYHVAMDCVWPPVRKVVMWPVRFGTVGGEFAV
jgi:hypothetical protein